jgi:hypothetical protein
MRSITIDELKELASKLPNARESLGRPYHVMRDPYYRGMYDYSGYIDYGGATSNKVTFRPERGHLDGSLIHYWTHNSVIVRVDV